MFIREGVSNDRDDPACSHYREECTLEVAHFVGLNQQEEAPV
jgi:hypothetical protein